MFPEWMIPSATTTAVLACLAAGCAAATTTTAVLACLAVGCAVQPLLRLLKGPKKYAGKHVLITGGSQGIGKEMALEFGRLGAHVTIIARTESKLKAACEEIKAVAPSSSKVQYVSADLTDFTAVQNAVKKAEAAAGPIGVCVANAGSATPGYLLEQSAEQHRKDMEGNYMSAVHAVKAVAPGMTERREGQITIVASAACVMAFIGYTSYCPSKFALRGFADALRNELKGFGVSVHIAYPPDTQTPGFDTEEQTKPKETSDLSKFLGGNPFPAAAVAKCTIDGMRWGVYHLPSPDWLQNRLIELGAVITPRTNIVFEITILPLLGVISSVVVLIIDFFGCQYGQRLRKQPAKKD